MAPFIASLLREGIADAGVAVTIMMVWKSQGAEGFEAIPGFRS